MATIYDGAPVFNAVGGVAAAAADQNTFQAKMILGLEERTITVPVQSAQASNGWAWVPYSTSNPPYWSLAGVPNAMNLLVPFQYTPSLTRITGIGIVIDGNEQVGDAVAGTIELYEKPIDATPSAWQQPAAGAVDIGGATPWRLASTVTEVSVSGLTFDTVAKSEYAVRFLSCNAVAGRALKVYSVYYTAQFHRGT